MSTTDEVIRHASPLWDMLGARMPRGLLGLSDPDVHRIDDTWVMFIGGFSTSFRNRLYTATTSAAFARDAARWEMSARPLTPDPPRGSWDARGMHTPSYVPAHAGHGPKLIVS